MRVHVPENPLHRYRDIFNALNNRRRWFESATYLRFAAIAALSCDESPTEIAREIRDGAKSLKRLSGWFGDLRSELRFVVATILRIRHDDPAAFFSEVDRVRKKFREVGVRRDAAYEMLAILVMRSGLNRAPIPDSLVQRVKDMYDEMKQYHKWLTGAAHIPACAVLAMRDESVGRMAQQIEQIHQGLHKEGMSRSAELQSSASLLFLSEGRAELAVGRAGELIRRFKAKGLSIRRPEYDDVAILAFLLNEPDEIVQRVLDYRDQVREYKPRPDKRMAFSIGANIAMLELVKLDAELRSISQIKLIIDIQSVIAAQRAQAAIIVATAAGT